MGTLAAVVLVSVAGAAVLAAVVGARRTESAYDRMLVATNASDLNVSAGQDLNVLDVRRVRALPHVAYAAEVYGLGLAPLGADGVPRLDQSVFAAGDPAGAEGFQRDRPLMLEGRMLRADRADEVVINKILATRRGLGVGDVFRAGFFSSAEIQALPPSTPPAEQRRHVTPVDLRIVGIARFAGNVLVNQNQDQAGMALSPALVRGHERFAGFSYLAVTLDRHDRDVPAFEAAMRRAFPSLALDFETRATNSATFDRTIGPYRDALQLFAVVAAVAGLLVVAQAMVRVVALDGVDGSTLLALGETRAQRAAALGVRAVVIVVAGVLLAVGLALVVSPIFPIGPARLSEPSPGFQFDGSILLAGGSALAAALLAPVMVAAWRGARLHATSRTDQGPSRRPSLAVELIATAGGPVSAIMGVRFALQRDRERGVPIATSLFGLVAAIATVAAVLIFATNLDQLVTTPQRYGWTWDALIDTYDVNASPAFTARLEADRQLAGLTIGTRATLLLKGRALQAYGFEHVRGHARPIVTQGRWPTSKDEVALGAETMRDLRVAVGGTVQARAPDGKVRRLRVVGRTVLPSLSLNGTYGLGEGAAVSATALRTLDPAAKPSFFLADLAPGVRVATINHRYGDVASALGPQRPADIQSYDHVRSTPAVLAGLLALLGIGVLVHVLVSSVRQRRRDLAVLKTIGLARGQVAATIAWQATTLTGLALLVGLPLGIVAGRWTWRSFTSHLGVSPELALPVLALGLIAVVGLALANVIAFVPARAAARTRPALVLRSE